MRPTQCLVAPALARAGAPRPRPSAPSASSPQSRRAPVGPQRGAVPSAHRRKRGCWRHAETLPPPPGPRSTQVVGGFAGPLSGEPASSKRPWGARGASFWGRVSVPSVFGHPSWHAPRRPGRASQTPVSRRRAPGARQRSRSAEQCRIARAGAPWSRPPPQPPAPRRSSTGGRGWSRSADQCRVLLGENGVSGAPHGPRLRLPGPRSAQLVGHFACPANSPPAPGRRPRGARRTPYPGCVSPYILLLRPSCCVPWRSDRVS